MGRMSSPAILGELHAAPSAAAQVQALRFLKNDIVGHDQKKERWIELGIILELRRILETHRQDAKRRQHDFNRITEATSDIKSEEEAARLQVVAIIGSLAHGGPAFVTPLRVGQIYSPLLNILCPTESAPSLVLAALRALNAIADSLALEDAPKESEEESFLQALYNEQHLGSLRDILNQDSQHAIVQQQISLAAALVAKSCRSEVRRKQLTLAGILDALATRVASFVIASGPAYMQRSMGVFNYGGIRPAGPKARLAPLLHAVCSIIAESKIRTSKFCCSSAFASIFPHVDRDPYSWRVPATKKSQHEYSNISSEAFVPPLVSEAGQTSNHPPFNSYATWGKQGKNSSRGLNTSLEATAAEGFNGREEDDTPLVAWLIEVVKAKSGPTRLMAIWLITLLFRSGSISSRRERSLSMLLVPILVGMLDNDVKCMEEVELQYDWALLKTSTRTMAEQTPKILSLLVAENEELQMAAAEAGVIKKLSQMLKQTFDPIPSSTMTPMWSPKAISSDTTTPSQSRLGPAGLQPLVFHTLQMRESLLMALGAMATLKDEYRKAITDNGVVQFLIESLKPRSPRSTDKESLAEDIELSEQKVGNTISILMAACATSRALSRSVTALRTILEDSALADPIFKLLRHSDLEVRIEATSCVCNLLVEFSPMRVQVIDAGVMYVLCEHAHSFNPRLRLNAIWALRHLVLSAPNDLKIKCVQELGPGWLKQIISNGVEDGAHEVQRHEGNSTPLMGTPNATGEQVDLLNAVDDVSQSTSFNQTEEDEVNMIDSVGPLSRLDLHRSRRYPLPSFDGNPSHELDPFPGWGDKEFEIATQNARDDLAVQEQGLTFVRNLICGGGASDMVDYLLLELGQDKVFDILTSLLRPKSVDSFQYRGRRPPGVSATKYVPPPTEIVMGVCYIMVHLAGSVPKHRQLLIAQSELLRLMVPLFTHPHSEVRLCCAWTVINLTWTDDQGDKMQSKNRAYELRKLGVLTKLHELENDPELDVRERTKNAIVQMTELLR